MCILCVVQRWSRRLAAMLPYLVIPLMLLWALSHFLPPGYRFEATSPRIACAAVLLLTLLWYEYILPRLSAWRARRSARLREMRREQALELHKMRKTATRRCRNCLTPYRDQNPGGGGRFMCSTCGHVSKRPVLELPGQVGNFGEKSRWLCSQFLSTDSSYWLDETHRCLAHENSLSVGCKVGKIVSYCSFVFRWICKRVFGFGSSGDNVSGDGDPKRSKRGQNGSNLQENRTEKARRKAEEKRLARLEKEMLEEEERKQREEVARLVEERRKLRDEKLEAEERSKGVTPVGERDGKKEAERKRQDRERRREKDRGSNKSNSDCDEIDKKSSNRETAKKRESDKKVDGTGICQGNATNKIVQQQSTRQKYFSTVAGNFKGFSGASFFGGSYPSATPSAPSVSKGPKTGTGFGNQSSVVKRDGQIGGGTVQKVFPNGDDKSSEPRINRPVILEKQPPPPAPKKAWHQLFKRNPVTPTPDQAITASNYQNAHFETYTAPPNRYFSTPPIFSRPTSPFPVYTPPNTGFFHPVQDIVPPPPVVEEQEQFEDPSFDPDPIALFGPVSESHVDSWPVDVGTGFVSREAVKTSKPSPIQSPLSRSRVSDDSHKPFSSALQDSGSNETGSWQLWGAPLTQNALGSVGGNKSGFGPKEETCAAAGVIGDVHSPRHLGGIRPPLPVTVPVPVQPVHIPVSVPGPVPNGESLFLPHSMMGRFGTAVLDTVNHSELSPTHHLSNRDQWRMNGPNEATNSTPASPRAGSLFSTDPAVQSVWLFNQKDAPST